MVLVHAAGTLAIATGGAFLFQRLGIPLAYILGAMAGSAIYANVVAPLRNGRYIRRGGQLVIGAAVGGLLTTEVVGGLVNSLPLMIAIAVAANIVGALLAFPVAFIAGIDRLTALLACLPAGMAEMATLAHDLDANEQAVAIIHTLRVIFVVTLLPILIGVKGSGGGLAPSATSGADLALLGAVMAASALLAVVADRFGLLNPWVVAPMLLGIVVVSAGGRVPVMPPVLVVAAQIVIGASLGARFRVVQLRSFPRASMAGTFAALVLIGATSVGLARLGAAVTDFDYPTLALSAAPGGLGEMIASAKALGLAAATVAGFQFVRSALTNLLVPLLIRRWVASHRRGPT